MVSWKRAWSRECDAGEMQVVFLGLPLLQDIQDNSSRQQIEQLSVSFVYRILHNAVCPIFCPV